MEHLYISNTLCILLTLLIKSGAMSGVWLNSPNTCKSLTQQMASLRSTRLWEPISSRVMWGLTRLNWIGKRDVEIFYMGDTFWKCLIKTLRLLWIQIQHCNEKVVQQGNSHLITITGPFTGNTGKWIGNTASYGSTSYGVNAALDMGHFEHPREDEDLLSHWQLGSRHWWLKWSLPQGSCQPLILAAYRQLDAPGNHTESHQFVMTHVRSYAKNILCQTGQFGLNSTELFSFRILRTPCISVSFTNGLTSSSA